MNHHLCTGCRNCVTFCQFNALAFINKKVKVFEEVCHSCGGCSLVCPVNAITEKNKIIGIITESVTNNHTIRSGKLNIGEESGVPIISKLLSLPHQSSTEIIDCPPGTSCSVIESIKDADFCIIVGEPTLFSLENLKMVVKLIEGMNLPFAILINKETNTSNLLREYANEHHYKIIASIPYKDSYAKASSNALLLTDHFDEIRTIFENLAETLRKEASR